MKNFEIAYKACMQKKAEGGNIFEGSSAASSSSSSSSSALSGAPFLSSSSSSGIGPYKKMYGPLRQQVGTEPNVSGEVKPEKGSYLEHATGGRVIPQDVAEVYRQLGASNTRGAYDASNLLNYMSVNQMQPSQDDVKAIAEIARIKRDAWEKRLPQEQTEKEVQRVPQSREVRKVAPYIVQNQQQGNGTKVAAADKDFDTVYKACLEKAAALIKATASEDKPSAYSSFKQRSANA